VTPALRLAVVAATAVVAVTGGVYAYLAWALTPAAPFDLVNHPWQPVMLHLHVLAAPAWLVVSGMLWATHIAPHLRARTAARRRTGWSMLALALPMVASGYLLQTAVDAAWTAVWRWTHVASASAWTLAFATHLLARVRRCVQPSTPSRRSSSADATSATVPGGCT
jgi:hypothetical protein